MKKTILLTFISRNHFVCCCVISSFTIASSVVCSGDRVACVSESVVFFTHNTEYPNQYRIASPSLNGLLSFSSSCSSKEEFIAYFHIFILFDGGG